jgi:crossover junction endodeoxyribonuclease RuvC
MRIVGIDPGLRITGYGAVHVADGAIEPTLIEAGIFRLDAKKSIESRLVQLSADLESLLDEIKPDHMAVEKLYSHYKHPRTAILMAHARGVILLAAKKRNIAIEHIAATAAKKAVTGHGHATKAQMQQAVQMQLKLPEPPEPADVADAIGLALTHARRLAVQQL